MSRGASLTKGMYAEVAGAVVLAPLELTYQALQELKIPVEFFSLDSEFFVSFFSNGYLRSRGKFQVGRRVNSLRN